MTPVTTAIKEEYGSLKHYCRVRGLNYQSFRDALCAYRKGALPSSSYYHEILTQDGFIQKER